LLLSVARALSQHQQQSIDIPLPAERAHSSKPAAMEGVLRATDGTDGQTNARPLYTGNDTSFKDVSDFPCLERRYTDNTQDEVTSQGRRRLLKNGPVM